MDEVRYDGAWYCTKGPQYDEKGLRNVCPPAGCPKGYCALVAGWKSGEPTPDGCYGKSLGRKVTVPMTQPVSPDKPAGDALKAAFGAGYGAGYDDGYGNGGSPKGYYPLATCRKILMLDSTNHLSPVMCSGVSLALGATGVRRQSARSERSHFRKRRRGFFRPSLFRKSIFCNDESNGRPAHLWGVEPRKERPVQDRSVSQHDRRNCVERDVEQGARQRRIFNGAIRAGGGVVRERADSIPVGGSIEVTIRRWLALTPVHWEASSAQRSALEAQAVASLQPPPGQSLLRGVRLLPKSALAAAFGL